MRNFEKNFVGKKWSVRIGWHQVALWRKEKPLLNWLTPWSDRLYSFRRGLYILDFPLLTYGVSSADLARYAALYQEAYLCKKANSVE